MVKKTIILICYFGTLTGTSLFANKSQYHGLYGAQNMHSSCSMHRSVLRDLECPEKNFSKSLFNQTTFVIQDSLTDIAKITVKGGATLHVYGTLVKEVINEGTITIREINPECIKNKKLVQRKKNFFCGFFTGFSLCALSYCAYVMYSDLPQA